MEQSTTIKRNNPKHKNSFVAYFKNKLAKKRFYEIPKKLRKSKITAIRVFNSMRKTI